MTKPVFGEKPPVKRNVGRASTSVSLARDEKDLDHRRTTEALDKYVYDGTGPYGTSGVSTGLTLPGPPRSYVVGRIEVSVHLPHGPSAEESKKALAVAVHLAQARLAKEAKLLAEYLDTYSGR